ncbi:MAG: hypothetical protein VKL42_08850 [Snowella sp.]|nr:hypothetical protein [Snowella sp.]
MAVTYSFYPKPPVYENGKWKVLYSGENGFVQCQTEFNSEAEMNEFMEKHPRLYYTVGEGQTELIDGLDYLIRKNKQTVEEINASRSERN